MDKTLDALYNANRHAAKYAALAEENYNADKKTTAKANSNRKKALYALKERVLTVLIDSGRADKIRRHVIHGDEFWCVYFTDSGGEEWSFHSPVDSLDIGDEHLDDRDEGDGPRELDDFEKDSEKPRSSASLKDSLLHLESEFGFNANEYLPDQYLSYGRNSHFIGWQYLGDD